MLQNRKLNLRPKFFLFGYYLSGIGKNYSHVWNQDIWTCQNVTFYVQHKKMWDQNSLVLILLGQNMKKTTAIFETNIFGF